MKTHTVRIKLSITPMEFLYDLVNAELQLEQIAVLEDRAFATLSGTSSNIMKFLNLNSKYIYDGRDEVSNSHEDSVSAI